MGLLYDLETRLEQQMPVRLQQSLQPALDDYQPLCPDCGLTMHRHHHYARTITTSYGVLRLQMPVFRCGACHRMASSADLLGAAERHQLAGSVATAGIVQPGRGPVSRGAGGSIDRRTGDVLMAASGKNGHGMDAPQPYCTAPKRGLINQTT